MDDEVDRPPPLAAVNEADNQLNDADDAVILGKYTSKPSNWRVETVLSENCVLA